MNKEKSDSKKELEKMQFSMKDLTRSLNRYKEES